MKFLVVDDDADILRAIEQLLLMKNHTVIKAETALEAIDKLNEEDIDIVLTDATMPEYSGFDLVRSLKRNQKFATLTIAMLTGRRDREDIEHALELGVQDYIVKPIEPEVLLKKIDTLVARHNKRVQKIVHLQAPKARLTLSVNVTRITDVGLTIESPMPLEPGNIVEMDVDELTRHMILKRRFRVIFSKKIVDSNMYSTEFILLDLSFSEKELLEKISRSWQRERKAA